MTFKLSPHPSDLGRDAGTPELRSDCRLLSNSVVAAEGPVRGILAAMVRLMALHQMLTHLKVKAGFGTGTGPAVTAVKQNVKISIPLSRGSLVRFPAVAISRYAKQETSEDVMKTRMKEINMLVLIKLQAFGRDIRV